MKKSFRAWSAKHSFKELVSVEDCRVTVPFYHLPCKELLFYFLKTYFEFTHINTEEDICRSPWTTASCYCVHWTTTLEKREIMNFPKGSGKQRDFLFLQGTEFLSNLLKSPTFLFKVYLFIKIFIYLNFLISTIAEHSWKKK